jgi:hypothetical protein
MAGNLTSADVTCFLGATDFFPVPFLLEMWNSDNPFEYGDITLSETVATLDGTLTGGYVYEPTMWTFTLEANSPSVTRMTAWIQAQQTNREMYRAFGNLTLPAYGKNIVMSQGILTRAKPAPGSRKILSAMTYQIMWERVVAVGI